MTDFTNDKRQATNLLGKIKGLSCPEANYLRFAWYEAAEQLRTASEKDIPSASAKRDQAKIALQAHIATCEECRS